MILVTGATGFVGSRLVKELIRKKNRVRCLVRNKKYSENKNLEVFYGDILDKTVVEEAVRGADYIVHLASVINPFDENVMDVNVEGTKNLVDAAKKNKVKRLVFLSTENVILDYKTPYSVSKLRAEKIVRSFKNHLILRPTVVYGKGDEKNFSTIIRLIKLSPIVMIPGSGKNKIQPIYVEDLVKVIINGIKSKARGTYLVAGNSFITVNELVEIVEKKIKSRRIKLHVSSSFLKNLARILEKTSKKPLIREAQIDYLTEDHVYDVKQVMKLFKYKPIEAVEGFKRIA